MKTIFMFITLLFLTVISFGQTDCACCTEYHNQFDFWLGEWNVYDTAGNKAGENTIVKLEDQCLLSEHWRGTQGGSGRSYSYFDSTDSTWNQVWIDNRGGNLTLKGKAEKHKMILTSAYKKGKKTDLYANRITWTSNEDGTVSQLWEVIDKNDKVLNVAFHGIYKRK